MSARPEVSRAGCRLLALLAFLVLPAAPAAGQASLTRGPYLQTGTPSSVIVGWRTSVATDSRVRLGDAPSNLTLVVDDSTPTTEHRVAIPGLVADTRYYYAVGSTAQTLAGADANHFFVTSPLPGTRKPTRIWVLGDSGTKNDNARAVRNAYYGFTGAAHTELWLMLGDNAYSSGTDLEYQAAVFDMYPEMLRKSVSGPRWATTTQSRQTRDPDRALLRHLQLAHCRGGWRRAFRNRGLLLLRLRQRPSDLPRLL